MSDLHPLTTGRFDVFEPGEKTALVCMDVPEVERLAVEQLTSIGYKIHTGISDEDLIFKMRAHPYDLIVISENFGASTIENNQLLREAVNEPASQRHSQIIVLV